MQKLFQSALGFSRTCERPRLPHGLVERRTRRNAVVGVLNLLMRRQPVPNLRGVATLEGPLCRDPSKCSSRGAFGASPGSGLRAVPETKTRTALSAPLKCAADTTEGLSIMGRTTSGIILSCYVFIRMLVFPGKKHEHPELRQQNATARGISNGKRGIFKGRF